ncbi:MAG TPA: DUF58 domain-containing protein, partial [Terriglobales bacterium]|nr:DUF58 domain-containing protein [Terriglobales bacterium]
SSKLPKLGQFPLAITREIQPKRSIGDEDVDVTLTIRNTTEHSIDGIQLEDKISSQLRLKAGLNRLSIALEPMESVNLRYRVAGPKRGTYDLGPTSIRFINNLGLRETTVELRNLDTLTVLPRIEELGTLDLKARRLGPWPGLILSRRIGLGTEFFELSAYSPGDDLRRVNWKASAKLGQLVTNEFEGEQVTDVLVALDCSQDVASRLFDFDVMEFEITLAASLCAQLIFQGNRVGLSAYGAIRTWVNLAFGKRQLLRILDNLAILKPGPATVPLHYAVESVITALVPARSVVVLISPLLNKDIVELAENIIVRGYNTICFTPSSRTSHQESTEPAQALARRILDLERRITIARLAKISRIIEVSPQASIEAILRARTR